jgi:hypothetical protein
MPQSHERSFAGSRHPESCFHAVTNVSWENPRFGSGYPVELVSERTNQGLISRYNLAKGLPVAMQAERNKFCIGYTSTGDLDSVVIMIPYKCRKRHSCDKKNDHERLFPFREPLILTNWGILV